jgi:hypothetical protein
VSINSGEDQPVIITSEISLLLQIIRGIPQNSVEVANFPLTRRFLPEVNNPTI